MYVPRQSAGRNMLPILLMFARPVLARTRPRSIPKYFFSPPKQGLRPFKFTFCSFMHIELPPFYRVHTQFPMPGVSPLFSGSGATVH